MSIEKVSTEVKRFLADSEPEVLAIKGKWGVGKTYQWNELVKESRNKKSLKLYSYVSLFGINSLEKLETEIAISQLDVNQKSKNVLDKSSDLVKHVMGKANYMGSSGITKAILFHSVEKTIICIDDLERKGKDLNLKDVLGLVSFLRENKKCKVVLLINDNEEGLEDFFKYSEKIIDNAILFSPTAEENFKIACRNTNKNDKPSNELKGELYETALKYVQKLNITNIRILTKIKKLILELAPEIKNFRPPTIDRMISSIVLFTWIYYSDDHDKTKPTLDFVLENKFSFSDKNDSDEKKMWKNTIHSYGFIRTNDIDISLADMIKNGYMDKEQFKFQTEQLNNRVIAGESSDEFHNIWYLYHRSFKVTKDEIISAFNTKFRENIKYLSPNDLQAMVSIFRDLNEDILANDLIDLYVENWKEDNRLFNINETDMPTGNRPIEDAYMLKKFKNHNEEHCMVKTTIEEILMKLSEPSTGWNPKDEEILAEASVDEYVDLLKTNEGKRFQSLMTPYWNFKKLLHSHENKKLTEFISKIEDALREIAKENEFNAYRIFQDYGIKI